MFFIFKISFLHLKIFGNRSVALGRGGVLWGLRFFGALFGFQSFVLICWMLWTISPTLQ